MMDRRNFVKTAGAGASLVALASSLSADVPVETSEERDKRMAWWREARFGMFIHWGIYSIPAGVWNGEKVEGIGEWIMSHKKIPLDEYKKLAGKFNPVRFDAGEWARIAKNAGMKYMVITSKHHDGFCMFDSSLTGYDIIDATPFKRDVIGELAEACADEDIRFGVYYSQLDWCKAGNAGQMARIPEFKDYMKYMKGQLRELLTNYGPFGSLFFDGDWMPQWSKRKGREIADLCRELQPDIIINDRVGKRPLVAHFAFLLGLPFPRPRSFVGDYITPEQVIPKKSGQVDWETCMTMNDTWGYKSWDHNWKSSKDLIRKLIDIASKGGNFLLNVGPTAEGLIPEPSVERLAEIGKWMDVNGDSIYGTTAGPLQNLSWGRTTQKPGKIYLHVFDWPDGQLVIQGLDRKIIKAYLLSDLYHASLSVKRSGGNIVIDLPVKAPDSVSPIVVLNV